MDGDRAFINSLNPNLVARDLVDDRFVRKAINLYGGPSAFNIPANFSRREEFDLA